MSYLPTFCPASLDVTRLCVGLDLGGSSLKMQVFYEGVALPDLSVQPIEDFSDEGLFFEWIAIQVHVFLNTFEFDSSLPVSVLWTFSFPMTHKDIRTVTVTKWAKGWGYEQGINPVLCLEQAFLKLSGRKYYVRCCVNDTTATLLAGMAENEGCRVSCVLGTGFNIGVLTDTIYNLECGAFYEDVLLLTEADLIVDGDSANPGEQRLEKCIGGLYLLSLIQASCVGIDWDVVTLTIADCMDFYVDKRQFDRWCSEAALSDDDTRCLYESICFFIERSFTLAACVCVAVVRYLRDNGLGVDVIIVNGSLYEKNVGYREGFCRDFRRFLADFEMTVCSVVVCPDASVLRPSYF